MELQGEGESPTLNAKRKLEEDFSKAVENDEDSEKNLNKRAEVTYFAWMSFLPFWTNTPHTS